MNYNYKVMHLSTSAVYANVALVKYLRETACAEKPLVKSASYKNRAVTYLYFETLAATRIYTRLLVWVSRQLNAGSSDYYSIIERQEGGQLRRIEDGLTNTIERPFAGSFSGLLADI